MDERQENKDGGSLKGAALFVIYLFIRVLWQQVTSPAANSAFRHRPPTNLSRQSLFSLLAFSCTQSSMSNTETNFRNSLRNFQSARAGPINLGSTPAATEHPNPFAATFSSLQSGASSVFSNVRNTVQGYVPLPGIGTQEPQEPSWLQLSTFEVRAGLGGLGWVGAKQILGVTWLEAGC